MRKMQQKRLNLKNNQFPVVDIESRESEIKKTEQQSKDECSLTQLVENKTQSEINEERM